MLINEGLPVISLIFEVISALCTVGLNTGVTGQLSSFGKTIILLLMLFGRSGILLLTFSFTMQIFHKRIQV
jgi:trk system potassium uptake protein TrkH